MFTLSSSGLELRGIENKQSKNGNVYYIIYVENKDGKPYNFYVPKAEALPQGLKKGDTINLQFDLSYFKGNERLTVYKVNKVA